MWEPSLSEEVVSQKNFVDWIALVHIVKIVFVEVYDWKVEVLLIPEILEVNSQSWKTNIWRVQNIVGYLETWRSWNRGHAEFLGGSWKTAGMVFKRFFFCGFKLVEVLKKLWIFDLFEGEIEYSLVKSIFVLEIQWNSIRNQLFWLVLHIHSLGQTTIYGVGFVIWRNYWNRCKLGLYIHGIGIIIGWFFFFAFEFYGYN